MPGLVFLLVFWVLAGACQRHGVGGFLLGNSSSSWMQLAATAWRKGGPDTWPHGGLGLTPPTTPPPRPRSSWPAGHCMCRSGCHSAPLSTHRRRSTGGALTPPALGAPPPDRAASATLPPSTHNGRTRPPPRCALNKQTGAPRTATHHPLVARSLSLNHRALIHMHHPATQRHRQS